MIDENRLNSLKDLILEWSAGNLKPRGLPSEHNDSFDELVLGLNIFADLLQSTMVSKQRLEQTEQELTTMVNDLDQLGYILGHDLKAPLRGIINITEFIEQDIKDGKVEDIPSHFELMKSRVYKMEGLISGIIEYSRSQIQDYDREVVPIKTILKEIEVAILSEKDFQISLSLNTPDINMGQIPAYQVFQNLISNAINHNDKDVVKIKVSGFEDDFYQHFSIKDNGPGIPKENQDKIFKIFYTTKPEKNRSTSGIGLSIVQKIIFKHGGDIKIESSENTGTLFNFKIRKDRLQGIFEKGI
jgi:signal transduction histidine kinase